MWQKLKNKEGFSLMEVMISMLILSIGILGLAPMMVTSIFGNSFISGIFHGSEPFAR